MIELKKLEKQFLKEMNDPELARQIDELLPEYFAADTTVTDSASLSLLILKSNSLTFSVQAREEELRDQGFFTRMLKGITGANNKMRSENLHDTASIGYLSTQMINQLLQMQKVSIKLIHELFHQDLELAHAILNIQNDINQIVEITKAMELYHIAQKKKTPWKTPLIELPRLQKYFAITMEFFACNTTFYAENTVIHYTNALESVKLDPCETFSVADLVSEFAQQPNLYQYLDKPDKEINDLRAFAPELKAAPFLSCLLAQRDGESPSSTHSALTRKTMTLEDFARVLFQEITSVQLKLAERRELVELDKFNQQRQLEQARQNQIISTSIQTDHLYRLCNIHGDIENNLAYSFEERKGINLEWRRTRSNIKFIVQDGDPIVRWGVPVSIFFDHLDGDQRTLAQSSQNNGIQIGWYAASDLRFEWVLVGGKRGEPVPLGSRFTLAHVTQGNLAYTSKPGDMVNLDWGRAKEEWCVKE